LQKIGPKTSGVIDGNRIFADDFQLTEKNAMVKEEEDQCAEILQDCQQLYCNTRT
jgi:hypothetical protein